MAQVSVVDYGIGNTGSILNMLRKLRVDAELVATPGALVAAQRLILPGIGAFDACIAALQRSGLGDGLLEFAARERPLLGICVGMQMLTLGSEEGELPGLGLIRWHTRRFAEHPGLRIPHMGWNRVRWVAPDHPLAANLSDGQRLPHRLLLDQIQIVLSDPSNASRGRDYTVYTGRTWRVSDLTLKRNLLIAGLGWGYLPEHMIADDLATGMLRALHVEGLRDKNVVAQEDPDRYGVSGSGPDRDA